uniref:14 kDa phosphohistidine phosphatase n=1 Tax=Pan paniscus TaxID=9597 RepID=A0A2R9CEN5_PANPA
LLPQALSVRGAPRAQSKAHGRLLRRPPIPADIYDKVSGDMQKQGCDCECLGGGRISHQSQDKKIHVYGYSMAYGPAQHAISTEKIKAKYPDYEVTWANDGY